MSSKTLVRALAFQASRSCGWGWRKARVWCVFSCWCLTNGYRFPSAEPFQRLLSSAVDPACDSGTKAEGAFSGGPASTANALKPRKSSRRVSVCRTAQLLYRRNRSQWSILAPADRAKKRIGHGHGNMEATCWLGGQTAFGLTLHTTARESTGDPTHLSLWHCCGSRADEKSHRVWAITNSLACSSAAMAAWRVTNGNSCKNSSRV